LPGTHKIYNTNANSVGVIYSSRPQANRKKRNMSHGPAIWRGVRREQRGQDDEMRTEHLVRWANLFILIR